jgi:hypothetical protein
MAGVVYCAMTDYLSLTSHFTIASDGREYLRIKSIDLQAGDEANLEFQSPSKGSRREVCILIERLQPRSSYRMLTSSR